MASSSAHQFATVNLNGEAAEIIRDVMRQTGWNIDQSLAHIFGRVVARYVENNNLTEVSDLAIEGNEVGVQVVKNTITSRPYEVGAVVTITVQTEGRLVGRDAPPFYPATELALVGQITGFAPQGPCVKLTERSFNEATLAGVRLCREDVWSYESITEL